MADIGAFEALQLIFWFIAGIISLYFSIGNARIWTSISTGFFLVFISEGYLVAPWIEDPRLAAIHSIVGTIAIMVLTHGFQEYYVFSRTLESGGRKSVVYLTTAGVILASMAFLWINPAPPPAVLRHIRVIANANWVFLALINLDMIRKIIRQLKGSRIARGFVAFAAVFALIFLWRGSELYLQVYAWDAEWMDVARSLGASVEPAQLARVELSLAVHRVAGFLSSLAVGGTFLYLFRLLR